LVEAAGDRIGDDGDLPALGCVRVDVVEMREARRVLDVTELGIGVGRPRRRGRQTGQTKQQRSKAPPQPSAHAVRPPADASVSDQATAYQSMKASRLSISRLI